MEMKFSTAVTKEVMSSVGTCVGLVTMENGQERSQSVAIDAILVRLVLTINYPFPKLP